VHKFVRNLITEWRRLNLPFDGETVIVAVSGGADSTALLLALADLKKRKKLDLEFIAAHFNHRLRGKESNSDEAFVRKLAKGAVFKFYSGSGSLKGTSNLEERARNVRYKFLAKIAKQGKPTLVLTAHTMNDQAETILMNLVRGTGMDGTCRNSKNQAP
jgi:tRNA(Ile)-lysidine synthase